MFAKAARRKNGLLRRSNIRPEPRGHGHLGALRYPNFRMAHEVGEKGEGPGRGLAKAGRPVRRSHPGLRRVPPDGAAPRGLPVVLPRIHERHPPKRRQPQLPERLDTDAPGGHVHELRARRDPRQEGQDPIEAVLQNDHEPGRAGVRIGPRPLELPFARLQMRQVRTVDPARNRQGPAVQSEQHVLEPVRRVDQPPPEGRGLEHKRLHIGVAVEAEDVEEGLLAFVGGLPLFVLHGLPEAVPLPSDELVLLSSRRTAVLHSGLAESAVAHREVM